MLQKLNEAERAAQTLQFNSSATNLAVQAIQKATPALRRAQDDLSALAAKGEHATPGVWLLEAR